MIYNHNFDIIYLSKNKKEISYGATRRPSKEVERRS
nr:MAG TPA: hypothetical protein [Caudoviricetes sp.]